MMPRSRYLLILLGLMLVLSCGVLAAQEHGAASAPASQQPQAAQQAPENPNAATSQELTEGSEGDTGEHEENTQFKYSPAVKWFARHFGIGTRTMYWISYLTNFLLVALVIWLLIKAYVPQAFRDRTASIQRGIKEAQAASADAQRRLADIEARLGKLDAEVLDIRSSAEREAAAEEERIKQAAEEDRQKIVQAAEAEIDAIARNARRELKGYAASLAVDLASREIKVDDRTDHALVAQFVDRLGKDGK